MHCHSHLFLSWSGTYTQILFFISFLFIYVCTCVCTHHCANGGQKRSYDFTELEIWVVLSWLIHVLEIELWPSTRSIHTFNYLVTSTAFQMLFSKNFIYKFSLNPLGGKDCADNWKDESYNNTHLVCNFKCPQNITVLCLVIWTLPLNLWVTIPLGVKCRHPALFTELGTMLCINTSSIILQGIIPSTTAMETQQSMRVSLAISCNQEY